MEFTCTKKCSFVTRSSDLFQYHIEHCDADISDLNDASVHDKLDADICPVCEDVFYTATELMKHVFDEHYCLRCLESCRHGVSTNKLAQENLVKNVETQVETNVTLNLVSMETQTDIVTPVTSVTSVATNTETIDPCVTSNVTDVTAKKLATNEPMSFEPSLKINKIKCEESIESDASLPRFEDLNSEDSNSIYKPEPMSEESDENGEILDNEVNTEKNIKEDDIKSTTETATEVIDDDDISLSSIEENRCTKQTIKVRTDLLASPTNSRSYEIKCDICDKVVKNAKGLEQHKLDKHSERHTTYYSNLNYEQKSSRKVDVLMKRPHKRVREPSTDLPAPRKRFKCDQCHKSYHTENDLKSHVEIIHNVVRYKCRFCSNIFDSEGHRRLHVTKVHKNK